MKTATNRFGIWTLTFLVIANMVGAGVFTTSGFTLADLRSPMLVVAAWVVGGVIAISGAAGYGQLARVMPESGGEYLFLSRAAHPLLGFIAGWVSLIAGFSGAIAFTATVFEEYLAPERIRPDWLPKDSVAIAAIIAAGVFHGLRAKVGSTVQNAVVAVKLGLLALLLLFAASKLNSHTWHTEVMRGENLAGWELFAALAGSLVWISLSYSGFNAAVYIADEAEDAERKVPRALLYGATIVTLLYVPLNAVFVCAAPAAEIAGKADVATVAAEWLGGSRFATFVRFTVSAAALTSVFSMVMAAPRVYAKMAEDGLMPRFLRVQGETPRAAMVVQVLVAVMLVVFSTLQGLLNYLALTLSLSAACTVACLFLPQVRSKPLLHPAHILPVIYIVGTVTAATVLAISSPLQVLGTLATVAAGVIAYAIIQVQRKRRAAALS